MTTCTEAGGFLDPMLEKVDFIHSRIRFRELLGAGGAGSVFKVVIKDRVYALKLFKFYYPELHYSRLKPVAKQACFDCFLMECRANKSLIDQQMNGRYTPICYGWTTISTRAEIHIARRFGMQLWDRPPGTSERIRGILYEYIEGNTILETQITYQIAQDIRIALKAIHSASIAHRDLRGSNILIRKDQVRLIDFSHSCSMPHIRITKGILREIQEDERLKLEAGLSFLLELPINRSVTGADISLSAEMVDKALAECELGATRWGLMPPPPPQAGKHDSGAASAEP